MGTISKNPLKYHELCQALDSIPAKGMEEDLPVPGISSREKAVLMALASWYGSDGQVFPSMAALARKLCFHSKEGVRYHLRSLEAKGYIWRQECFRADRVSGTRRQTSNSWYFSEAVCLIPKLRQKRQAHEEKPDSSLLASLQKTRTGILLSLERARKRTPGRSVRNGRLGYLTRLEKKYAEAVRNRQHHPDREALKREQEKLKKVQKERAALLNSPSSEWAACRILGSGESRSVCPESLKAGAAKSRAFRCSPSESAPPDSPKSQCSSGEQKPAYNYAPLYAMWRENNGPALTRKDRKKFESESELTTREAMEAAGKVLKSPFLTGRFQSLMWLAHIHKEEHFEKTARRETGRFLADEIQRTNSSLRECLKDFNYSRIFDTYRGRTRVLLDRNRIIPWVCFWTDKAEEAVRKRKMRLPDDQIISLDIPF